MCGGDSEEYASMQSRDFKVPKIFSARFANLEMVLARDRLEAPINHTHNCSWCSKNLHLILIFQLSRVHSFEFSCFVRGFGKQKHLLGSISLLFVLESR